jgi:transcriptional regulator with XRE-family HTH domain
MELIIKEIGLRLREMREILAISAEDMAEATGVSTDDYQLIEAGGSDFSFTFLHRAALRLNIDMTDLLTGESPHRSGYTLIRSGEGLPIERRAGFRYRNLAPFFRGRLAEPFHVTAPEIPDGESCQIVLGSHAGQEMDYILSGTLRVRIEQHEEYLRAGDTLYYDSGKPHGMVAVGGPCMFLAFVITNTTLNQEDQTC